MSAFDLYQTVTDEIIAIADSWPHFSRTSEESGERQAVPRRQCVPVGLLCLCPRLWLFLPDDFQPGDDLPA